MGLIPGWGRFPGEGNGNSLQYSCLGRPLDRGAWSAIVHGVANCWTQLDDWAHTWLSECDTINTKSPRKLPVRFIIAVKDWLWKYLLYIINTFDREKCYKITVSLLAFQLFNFILEWLLTSCVSNYFDNVMKTMASLVRGKKKSHIDTHTAGHQVN